MPIRVLKACLNGGRHRAEHEAVPAIPEELALAAARAVAAGAEAIHIHPRGHDGTESLRAADIGSAIRAVRDACPGTPIGVSTGLWITGGDPRARLAAVDAWGDLPAADRPDFASVNLGEPGFAGLAERLLSLAIDVEAGVWSPGDADALAASGLGPRCARVLVEIIGVPAADAERAAAAVLDRLDTLGVPGPVLLHGEDDAAWPLVAMAGRLGLATRIGLEDTLVGAGGGAARDNADLVHQALATWRQAHRRAGLGRTATP